MSNEDQGGSPAIVNRRAQKAAQQPEQEYQAPRKPALTADPSALEEADADARARRQSRRPFGTHVQKLAYPARPGYHRHWFNDEPGRIEQAKDAAYTHVQDPKTNKPVMRPVGKAPGGGALYAYLMEIPLSLWKEDMAIAQAEGPDRTEQSIKRAKPIGKDGTSIARGQEDNFYSPGVKIEKTDRFR